MNSDHPASAPYSWLSRINPQLLEQDESALFGYAPSFDWSAFSETLQSLFQLTDLRLTPTDWQWRIAEELLDDIGESLIPTGISLTPLQGTAYWIMPEADLNILMSKLLTPTSTTLYQLTDEELRMGFYRYLAVEILYQLDQTPSFTDYTLRLLHNATLPAEVCLCLDLQLDIGNNKMIGRLIVPATLRHSWKQHSLLQHTPSFTAKTAASTIELPISIEIAQISYPLEQWSALSVGDIICLPDSKNWDITTQTGAVTLSVRGHHLGSASIEEQQLKITNLVYF